MTQKVLLSAAGMQNAAVKMHDNNFTFIVGDHKYYCNSFFADFISPKVAQLHISDPLADTFVIKSKDAKHEFQLVMDIMYGKKVILSQENQKYLLKISKKLGNSELYNQFETKIEDKDKPEEIDFNEIFELIRVKYKYQLDYQHEIDIIAKYFYFLDKKYFTDVPFTVMERILNSPKLVIDTEKQLFGIICELIDHSGPEYAKLLTNLVYENIEKESIVNLISKLKGTEVDGALWEAICKRLVLDVPDPHDYSRYRKTIDTLNYNKEKHFNGIFAFLTQLCKGNPAESLVAVSALREHNSTKCDKLFSNEKVSWGLTEVTDNYLLFDFKLALVKVTGYEIRSGTNSHWDNPQSWVIEVSNDKSAWTVIDNKVNNTEMGGNEKIHYWKIEEATTPSRYVRWRLTKNGTGGLYCKQWELYGDYIRSTSDVETIREK